MVLGDDFNGRMRERQKAEQNILLKKKSDDDKM